MTDAERDALRAKILADGARLHDSLAPFYLAKKCPWNGFQECIGTHCTAFLPQLNENGKIAGAACCIPLVASQIGPISDGLMQIAQMAMQNTPRILAPPAGLVQG